MKLVHLFKTPDAITIASRDLEEAKRNLLSMQSAAEHAAKMVEYYEGVVNRLSNYVRAEVNQASQ